MTDIDSNGTKEILTRLKTVRGHVAAVERMIEEGKSCDDILLQLVAIRSAVQKASVIVAQRYANICLNDAMEKGGNQQEAINKAIETLMKLNQ